MATDWSQYPFKLVDTNGHGHDDTECKAIRVPGTEQPNDDPVPWPCPYCVPAPQWTKPQGSVWVPRPTTPNPASPMAQEGTYSPEDRLLAVFGRSASQVDGHEAVDSDSANDL